MGLGLLNFKKPIFFGGGGAEVGGEEGWGCHARGPWLGASPRHSVPALQPWLISFSFKTPCKGPSELLTP